MVDERNPEFITPQELNEKLHDSELIPQVIDVRPAEEYQAGHIPNAVNLPSGEILESLKALDTKRPIVVYCNMRHPGGSSSERAAQELRRDGVQVRVLQGGLPAWQQAGYQVEQGPRFQRAGQA
jgi:ArsR family transcriptional regulator